MPVEAPFCFAADGAHAVDPGDAENCEMLTTLVASAALLLQGCGLVGFSQMFPPLSTLQPPAETPAPVAQDAKAAPPKDGARQQGEVAGLHRVSRHPFLWSLGLLGSLCLGPPTHFLRRVRL
eukprot:2073097-Rhodomonas_salina.2